VKKVIVIAEIVKLLELLHTAVEQSKTGTIRLFGGGICVEDMYL
jgi:hypothetical protein